MYRHLVETNAEMSAHADSEPPAIKMLKNAVHTILETALYGFFHGFLPAVESRRRRSSAPPEERGYLELLSMAGGALMGRRQCSHIIACRLGSFLRASLPGAQLAVMLAESVVPQVFNEFLIVVKESVVSSSLACEERYQCSLVEEELSEVNNQPKL